MKDLSGEKFGLLTVQSFAFRDVHGAAHWHVVCACGTRKTVSASNLRGTTKSCGCKQREKSSQRMTTHGMSGTVTHRAWKSMIARCHIKSATGYSNYGGRGIVVCERWRTSFAAFMADMGTCPSGHSIERKDVDGNYEPSNCIWATKSSQSRNTRVNRRVGYAGNVPLVDAVKTSSLSYDAVRARLNRGWDEESALLLPANTKIAAVKISARGATLTIPEWAKRIGVDPKAIRTRLANGWFEEDAVTLPKGSKRPREAVS